MKLTDLKPAQGAKTPRRRVGRGYGSGRGKTAGRGHKGQRSRSGFSQSPGWEGGRSALIARLPKRGFNKLKEPRQIVNLSQLNMFEDNSEIDSISLFAVGLIRHLDQPVKLLGNGELERNGLQVYIDAASQGAIDAIQKSGGSVTIPGASKED